MSGRPSLISRLESISGSNMRVRSAEDRETIKEAIRALSAPAVTPQPSTDKRREEIARIADPDLWRSRDILLNQAQMYRDAPADEVEPNGYARFAEQREQAAASVIEPSLAKADAIMALPPLEGDDV